MSESNDSHKKNLTGIVATKPSLAGRFCSRPFERFQILHGHGESNEGYGNVYLCCPSMLPKKIGNYNEQSLDEIWNSKSAQEIRQSVIDETFKYCQHELCPQIQGGTLPMKADLPEKYRQLVESKTVTMSKKPLGLYLCYDRSCNLSCPSCRNQKILHANGGMFEQNMRLTEKLFIDFFSEPSDHHLLLCVTGSGDPFASKVFRHLLRKIDCENFPNLQIDFYTNGLLLNEATWREFSNLHGHIRTIVVSMDAGTEKTYQKVRGGSWQQLNDNLQFISARRHRGEIKALETNFVVQDANYKEIPQFIQVSKSHKVDAASFCLVMDWGTWLPDNFLQQCIWRKDHPDFENFIDTLRHPLLHDPINRLGSLTEYVRMAKGTVELCHP